MSENLIIIAYVTIDSEKETKKKAIDSLHNSIVLSISGHCSVFVGKITEKHCCLFPVILVKLYWKEENERIFLENKNTVEKTTQYLERHGWWSAFTKPMPLLEKFFVSCSFENQFGGKNENPFMRIFSGLRSLGESFLDNISSQFFCSMGIFLLNFCTCFMKYDLTKKIP